MSRLAKVVSVLGLACVLGPTVPLPSHAQSPGAEVDVRWTDAEGVRRAVRVPGSSLARNCTSSETVVQGTRTELTVVLVRTQTPGRADLIQTTDGYRLVGVDGLMEPVGTCEASPELLAAIASARPAVDARGPWLAFFVLGGFVLLAIVAVAMAGKGVGPEAHA